MKGKNHFNNEFFGASAVKKEVKEVESTASLVVAPSAITETTSTLAQGVPGRHVDTNDVTSDPTTQIEQTTLAPATEVAQPTPAKEEGVVVVENNYTPTYGGGFGGGVGSSSEEKSMEAKPLLSDQKKKNYYIIPALLIVGTIALIHGARMSAKKA